MYFLDTNSGTPSHRTRVDFTARQLHAFPARIPLHPLFCSLWSHRYQRQRPWVSTGDAATATPGTTTVTTHGNTATHGNNAVGVGVLPSAFKTYCVCISGGRVLCNVSARGLLARSRCNLRPASYGDYGGTLHHQHRRAAPSEHSRKWLT